ncbi:MAG: cyclic nucleotide-binding domain-containing protein [bacterium]|nr:cyclic nucleotide-binding domain-containing protein [bacterium]
MNRDHTQHVKSIVQKVKIFRRFTISEAQRLLKLCQYRTFTQNEVIYRQGEPSGEMLILLQGRVAAVNEAGTVLGEILPGTTTGEMGVLTGQPRSATILALENASGFAITKVDLEKFLRDQGVRLKVFENMVDVLCERLTGANLQIENFAKKQRDSEE